MKRLTIILFSLLALGFSTAAQSNLYVWSKDGRLSVYPSSAVDNINVSKGDEISLSASTLSVNASQFKVKTSVSFGENIKSLTTSYELGVCFSSTDALPTVSNDCCIAEDGIANIRLRDPGTKYYYRAYLKFLDEVFYSDVADVTTDPEKSEEINSHKFIDLGLPSGVLWATCNVGASKETDDGDLYAWGETINKARYWWDTYIYYGTDDSYTKYNTSDGIKTLDASDDTATANWGEGCRMPTYDEMYELYKNCEWDFTWYYNGKAGAIVTGPNGNKIFIPAAGFCQYSSNEAQGLDLYIWSSTLQESIECAYVLTYTHNGINYYNNYSKRCYGFSVRPVASRPTQE